MSAPPGNFCLRQTFYLFSAEIQKRTPSYYESIWVNRFTILIQIKKKEKHKIPERDAAIPTIGNRLLIAPEPIHCRASSKLFRVRQQRRGKIGKKFCLRLGGSSCGQFHTHSRTQGGVSPATQSIATDDRQTQIVQIDAYVLVLIHAHA